MMPMRQGFDEGNTSGSATERAHRWLARFAPFLYDIPATTAGECRDLIARVRTLRDEGTPLLIALSAQEEASPDDASLTATLREAIPQLDGIEEDLRRRLARLAPGDPDGVVDLGALREKMAERAAREELGETLGVETPGRMEGVLSHGNWVAAGGALIFGTGWTAFTLFHATLMIGGMWKAFGPPALLMLLFYSIFFAVGFGMLYGAAETASKQNFTLDGRTLTVTKTLGAWVRTQTWTLAPATRAEIVDTSVTQLANGITIRSGGNRSGPTPMIVMRDVAGKEVRLGAGMTPQERIALCERLNAHLTALG